MSADGIGWDFVQTLMNDVGLDRETAERVQVVVEDSGFFLTRESMNEELDKRDQEMYSMHDTLMDRDGMIDELKDMLDRIKEIVNNAE